mgnify:CR=1 FL=1
MKKFFVAGIVVLCALMAAGVETEAQLGVGAKVPPLIMPNFFVAYDLTDVQMIELMGTIQSVQFASSITVGATLKQFLNVLDIESVPLRPFLGGGATITLATVNVVGQSSSSMAIALSALAGVEYAIGDTSLSASLEFIPSVVLSPIFGFHIGGAIGVRFDF